MRRVAAPIAFSVGATLALMWAVSGLPGMAIPIPYWVFGAVCPAVISFIVSVSLLKQVDRIDELQRQQRAFIDLLSHDMRAPLTSILAVLDSRSPEGDPDIAQRLRSNTERALRLADDMVRLARAQSLQFRHEPLNLVGLALDAVDALTPQASARQIEIELTYDDIDIEVAGEPSLIARAFTNLLDNAIKFSPPSSRVTFAISRAYRDQRKCVACTITDNGIGIPAHLLPSVYRPFLGAQANNGEPLSGAGLGLLFVKTVVDRHGGSIHCETSEGHGTTFRIELPAGPQ